jgi:tetratricopeptide (TPR) repeat protein
MNKLNVLIFTISISQIAHAAAVDSSALWKEAIGIYTMESDDYIETITDSIQEIKFWRESILKDVFDKRSSEVESSLALGTQESITEIENFFKINGYSAADDSVLMKLAQLHYNLEDYNTSKSMKAYEQIISDPGLKSSAAPELPIPNYSKVVFYTSELLHKFPNSTFADSAHYLLAYCLSDEGKTEKAVRIYERQLLRHPFSEFSNEVKWRLAEDYYDTERFQLALPLYKSLTESKNKFALGATYKMGTVYFTQNQFTQAAPLFLKVYKESSDQLNSNEPEIKTFLDESLDYLARLKGRGVSFNTDLASDIDITERLGEIFHKNGLRERERQTYSTFVRLHSDSAVAPRFMNRVIQSYLDDALFAKAAEVRERFLSALDKHAIFWDKIRKNIVATVEAEDLVEENLLSSAQYFSQRAFRTKLVSDYKSGMQYFDRFLRDYPASLFLSEALSDRADLNYAFGEFGLAARDYLLACQNDPTSEWVNEAAEGYLLSESMAQGFTLNDKISWENVPLQHGLKPLKEGRFLKAAAEFLNYSSQSVRRQLVLYQMAQVYYSHGEFYNALKSIEKIKQEGQITEVLLAARHIETLIFSAQKDLQKNQQPDLTSESPLILVTDPVDFPEFTQSDNLSKNPELLTATVLLRDKKGLEAAKIIEEFIATHPSVPNKESLLYTLAYLFRLYGDIPSSTKNYNTYLREFQKGKHHVEAAFLIISNKVSLLKFEDAAAGYQDFVKKYPKHTLTRVAYLNAAYLWLAIGDLKLASSDYGHFVENKPIEIAGLINNIKKNKQTSEIPQALLWGWKFSEGLMVNKNQNDEIKFLKNELVEDFHNPRIYAKLALLYEVSNSSDLARITLDEGLRNTEQDSTLLLEKAYLSLSSQNFAQSPAFVAELNKLGTSEAEIKLFQAFSCALEGKKSDAIKILDHLENDSDVGETDNILLSRLTFKIITKDFGESDSLLSKIDKMADHKPYINYLLGSFFTLKGDERLSLNYFKKIKTLGIWSAWLKTGKEDKQRIPAGAATRGTNEKL